MELVLVAPIPDFTSAEHERVTEMLRQRFGRTVELQFADTELQLGPDNEAVTSCPTLCWQARGVDFVLCKVAPERYRARFFVADGDASGEGADDCDDLGDCVLTLLRLQSDHERHRAGISSGATAADLPDVDDSGPAML